VQILRNVGDDARRDAQYAWRTLRRNPGFAAVALLTLSLGIGANTAVFSVVKAVLLRPLPFADADRLVRVYEHVPASESPDGRPRRMNGMLVRDFVDAAGRTQGLSHLVSYGTALVTIAGGSDAVRLPLAPVTPDTFSMFDAHAIVGRTFTAADADRGADRVVILSYAAWQRQFAGDPAAIGRRIRFNGSRFSGNVALDADYTVVGVMPASFRFAEESTQFWIPLRLERPPDGRPRRTLAIARLAPGVSLHDAAMELGGAVADLHGAGASAPRFELVRLQDEIGEPVKPALVVLTIVVGLVLLVACANVANLVLARNSSREREIATRIAIGASRGRLVRQLLTESLLLAIAGGIGGTLLAAGGVSLFRTLAAAMPRIDLGSAAAFPCLDAIRIDAQVWTVSLAFAVVTGLLVGTAPALRHSRAMAPGLVRRPRALQSGLAVAQIAIATMLVVAGGLLARSFVRLTSVDVGFDPGNVLTFQVSLPGAVPPLSQQKTFAEGLVASLRSLPDVRAAAYANQLPMMALRDTAGGFTRTRDRSIARTQNGPDARLVSRDYFAAMGIRIVAGRGLSESDDAGGARVLVINQTLAHQDFGAENPIGQDVYIGRDAAPWRIVGIVNDVRQFGRDRQPEPQFFADVGQWPETGPVFPIGAYYAIRVAGDPSLALARVRDVVRQISPQASVDNVATMNQILSNATTRPRLYAVLLTIFAAIAILIAAAGIYGVMAYTVAQRTREIGIRVALGADRRAVLTMVLGRSAGLTIAGLVGGLAGAAATTKYLEGLLFGLTPLDPATFIAAPIAFAAVAFAASYVPARRATAVDPSTALRAE
jgi:putative ABC transport system permease protein